MIWVSFAITLVRFVIEYGPDMMEWLQKIFGRWQSVQGDRALKAEAKVLTGAMREKLAAKYGFAVDGPCPIEAYYAGLDTRHPAPAAS